MKPPSKDAITKALNILLESIQEENKLPFASSCIHPLDAIPFEQLATNVEVLGLAKAHLDKEAEDIISRIQSHRNLAAPIHRLPREIFAMILEYFSAGQPVDDEHGLLQLLRVGRLWYRTIINSPRLWTWLDSALPPKIARLVIERSKDLPILSFVWESPNGYDGNEEEREEILEMAVQNSTRFKSMNLMVSTDDLSEIRPLLEGPTTALEALTVQMDENEDAIDRGFEEFVLSEGAPLKYLVLDDITLNFDSPRLAVLVTLSLNRAAVPTSLNILLQLLSATQRLEQLTLSSTELAGGPVAPGPQVTLGHLQELKIEGIRADYCAALLSSLYTPACSRVHVSDSGWSDTLDQLLWQPGNAQMAALLGLNQQSDTRTLKISITAIQHMVSILIREEEVGSPRVISFARLRPSPMAKLLGQFFAVVPFCPQIDLTIKDDVAMGDPFDLTSWSGCLESLELSHPTDSLRVMEQLAQHTVAPNANETGISAVRAEVWMCPKLRYITLHVPEAESQPGLYGTALLSLVRTRWSRTDGGPTPAIQPAKFVIIGVHSGSKTLQDVEAEVKRVVPSAVFHRGDERPSSWTPFS